VSLETINSIAQSVGAIGVIASLFYLAVQIRQNTRSQRSLVVDSLTSSLINLLSPQAADPELTQSFASAVEDWNGASVEDRSRAAATLFTLFKLFENAWFQYRQETLDREQWEGWDLYVRVYFHRPGVQGWWADRKAMFGAGFRDYVESTKPVRGVRPLSELIRGKP
jgi:hypothetical protein